MVFYIVIALIVLTIFIYLITEFIHLPKKKFKKNLKLGFLIILLAIVFYLMRFFPGVISSIPAIFLILYRWGNVISFFSNIFLKKKYNNTQDKMTKKEALEILGLREGASREQIISSHQNLVKKNHPDLGGSDWVTKKLNQARDILLG
jgi:hypothetical protein